MALSHKRKKKTDAVKHLSVFFRIGLLFNEPPGTARLPLI